MICSTFITPQQSYGQFDEEAIMDSILKVFPPDSHYVKNEVIVKFKKNALDLNKLCYSYSLDNLSSNEKRIEGTFGLNPSLRDFLSNQRFAVEDILIDSSLISIFKKYGGDSLKRITHANPCLDTLSLTRSGDTIPMADYLYMVLLINNDSSVVNLTVWPTLLHDGQIDYVEPNMTSGGLLNYIPNDYHYGEQKSLKPAYTNTEFAWNYERGDPSTLVAVIDQGIDYRHCDLGNWEMGPGKKVVYGYNIYHKNNNFHFNSPHGSMMSGIIGAFTNRSNCVSYPGGVAGIAGGWKNDTLDEPGCSLLGYKTWEGNSFKTEYHVQAVLESSNKSLHSNYGEGVHIINSSFGVWGRRNNFKAYEEALNTAFENQLVQVSGSGNKGDKDFIFPSSFEPHKMIKVGAYNRDKLREDYSTYGHQIDLLGPGGEQVGPDRIVFTTDVWDGTSYFIGCNGASSATAHVSGTTALIHSYAKKQGWTLYPEDYEGIIKAATQDITSSGYLDNYDEFSGWGNLDLQKIFFMFQQGYRLFHYSNDDNNSFNEVTNSLYPFDVIVSNPTGKRPMQVGGWQVREVKTISKTVSHTRKWMDYGGFKIFVWGRSGPLNGKHGFALLKPPSENPYIGISGLFQNGFTGVYSGYGGNYLTNNMIHDYDNSFNQGTNSHEFKLYTHQYAMRPYKGFQFHQLYPLKSQIAMHYTVFAKEIPAPTSVYESVAETKIKIHQNQADQNVFIYSDMIAEVNALVKISNSMGLEMFSSKNHISNRIILDVRNYPSGVYFVTISNGVQNSTKPFVLQK